MTKTADIDNKRNTIQTTKLRIKNNLNRLKMLFLYEGNKRMQKKKCLNHLLQKSAIRDIKGN